MSEENETAPDMDAVSEKDVETLMTGIMASADAELREMPREGLERFWFFRFDPKLSIAANTYAFTEAIDMYRRKCRRWEEIHNGSGCVVERVRDTYLMPRIRDFEADIRRAIGGEGT